jgi:hypothetical protein
MPHSAVAPPPDAIELLWRELGSEREEISFANNGGEIEARTGEDEPVAMTRDERAEIGRRRVLAVLREVCEESSALEPEWFAVSSDL